MMCFLLPDSFVVQNEAVTFPPNQEAPPCLIFIICIAFLVKVYIKMMQSNISVLITRQCTSSTLWFLANLLLALGKFLRFSFHKFTTLVSLTALSCVALAYFLDDGPIIHQAILCTASDDAYFTLNSHKYRMPVKKAKRDVNIEHCGQRETQNSILFC